MQSQHTSIWVETGQSPSFPKLEADLETDVVIVGGGITGITTAYLLAKKGLKVVVLESAKVGSGTTGFSTGHLTSGVDADYNLLLPASARRRPAWWPNPSRVPSTAWSRFAGRRT
jgi:glycine/D-amino acid oxidase-like deaminating enzyme